MKIKDKSGFTLIEILVVIIVIVILLSLAGQISGKFAERRSIDGMAHRITSYLNLVKIQAGRNGVEYKTVLNFDPGDSRMSFITQRGDSNRNSTNWTQTSSEVVILKSNYDVIPEDTDIEFTFTPSSTVTFTNGQTLTIKPETENTNIQKCAIIGVTNFGKIRTVIGRWNHEAGTCRHIHDKQETSL